MFGSDSPSQYLLQSASGLVKKATGLSTIQGILAATSSSAVIQVWDTPTDQTNALAKAVTGQLSIAAGTPYPIPAKINYGLYVQLVSGSGTWTVFFD